MDKTQQESNNRKKQIYGAFFAVSAVIVVLAVVLNLGLKQRESKAVAAAGKIEICGFCGNQYESRSGCIDGDVFIGGKKYPRVLNADSTLCFTCGAGRDAFHHKGCKMERCPKCNGFMSSCDCPIERMANRQSSQ